MDLMSSGAMKPELERTPVDNDDRTSCCHSHTMTIVGVVTFVSVVCVLRLFLRTKPPSVPVVDQTLDQKRRFASFIPTLGAVVWPFVLLCIVKREDHSNSVLVLPVVWNVCLWLLDVHFMHNTAPDSTNKPATVRTDPMLLAGLAFGMCNLVGSRPDSKHVYLFIYAIVTCFLLVLPSNTLRPESLESHVVSSVQKVIFHYCIGLLLTGVILTHTSVVASHSAPLPPSR